jgi:hypothetical protein
MSCIVVRGCYDSALGPWAFCAPHRVAMAAQTLLQ